VKRAKYEQAVSVVRAIVHEWDPYSLLAGGAPPDEFDAEIASIVAQIPRIRSRKDAAHAISRVFSSAFQREGFTPDDCAETGAKLFDALSERGLVNEEA